MKTAHIGIIGDFNAAFPPHLATDEAIVHASKGAGLAIVPRWIPTTAVIDEGISCLADCAGVWIAPGSPYRNMHGALRAIRHARLSGIPLLATCGGFQHVVLEYARNVLGFADAAHAEYDPYASRLFVTPLSCSLVGRTMAVQLSRDSRVRGWYNARQVSEQYYCNFGLNSRYESHLRRGGLPVVGWDADGEARVLELPGHPFFVATLFVPQLTSTAARPHPLISAFVAAAVRSAPARRRPTASVTA
jgi:CTP synthase (UTP-ammonia lyase)